MYRGQARNVWKMKERDKSAIFWGCEERGEKRQGRLVGTRSGWLLGQMGERRGLREEQGKRGCLEGRIGMMQRYKRVEGFEWGGVLRWRREDWKRDSAGKWMAEVFGGKKRWRSLRGG